MLVLEWKERAFIEKVNSRFFCWFPAAILVHQNSAPIWRLHTKLYKGAWKVSGNNSETVGHKDLRLGQIVQRLVFYNIPIYFFVAWQWKRLSINPRQEPIWWAPVLGRTRGKVHATPFLSFVLPDKTSAHDVFSSCSFISRTHFEPSSVTVSFYGFEIWRHMTS